MGDRLVVVTTMISAVGCGLVSGIMLAFSLSVMRALRRLPPNQGIAAMQAMNKAILNPVFSLVFVGTLASCVVLAGTALFSDVSGAGWRFAGALMYIAGAFLVTVIVNVPMNNRLAAVDASSPEGAVVWQRYLARWTAWNHLRAVAAALAATMLVLVASY